MDAEDLELTASVPCDNGLGPTEWMRVTETDNDLADFYFMIMENSDDPIEEQGFLGKFYECGFVGSKICHIKPSGEFKLEEI